MYASRRTKELTEVPGWPGVSVLIQQLPGRTLERARIVKSEKALEAFRKIRGFQRELDMVPSEKSADAPAAPAVQVVDSQAVLDEFDTYTVVAAGVKLIDGQAPGEQFEDDLGEDELAFLHEQVLRLSVPRRFETEADQKNG